jgi:hypothetical protein
MRLCYFLTIFCYKVSGEVGLTSIAQNFYYPVSGKVGFASIVQSFCYQGSGEVGFASIAQSFCYQVSSEVFGQLVFSDLFLGEPFFCFNEAKARKKFMRQRKSRIFA